MVKRERVGAFQFQARSVASIHGGQSWWALLGGAPRHGEAETRWGRQWLVVETKQKPIGMNLQEGEFRVMVNKANWPKFRVTGLKLDCIDLRPELLYIILEREYQ